ncbi:TRAP transporter permease [Actinobacteria bacterium YIM 96077]|uniref:TRAP transporter permease n=1 Tax=Phytoactinopolyspora halophila TaxID=1981511 RepID=A0A329QYP3_9ACTN|nr:TRAP transporter permease [Phytoactinopolyspora halophila]AYY13263.1 TRAP transporter permease [Actinobacteria bacterium YIM 96077]RAW17500.1 TRAP transporter permease [Phytoactinopolyspora halophila]
MVSAHDTATVADQGEATERAHEVLRKHDTASRYRIDLGPWAWVVGPLAIALTVFQLYTALYGARPSLVQGAMHVGAAMGLVFLLYPVRPSLSNRRGIQWYDVLLAAAALATNIYIVVNYERLTGAEVRILGYTDVDHIVAVAGILLVLEATRRCVGLPIVVIASIAILYGIFGPHMPIFPHAGYTWDAFAVETFFTSRSVFGTPIQVSSTFIFLFLLFGVLLVKTNIGGFFNDLAYRATGRYSGGPAKAAIVASGAQGMVSGSSVANTVASGSFTIPMMKRAGFRPSFAAATEASASTGGQLMPPVMGAAAFIMAEYTGVAYSEIIVLALLPALLYFSGLFMGIHFEAKRRGIVGVDASELPAWRGLLLRLDLLLPLVVIVTMLLSGRTPANAALWGIAAAFVLSFARSSTRLSPRAIVGLLEAGARVALPVIAACATAGIVAGTVTATGLGGKIAGGILDLAFGQFPLVLIFTMLACLLLGMGLPTTANYVVTATIAAPILLNEFDVPVIAAHLFVFYFGILADITPPVCLAAYAGSGIAGSNPLKTGVTALRIAIVGFIIPYIFILEPALLLQDTSIGELIPVVVTALLGLLAVSSGLTGYLLREAYPVERLLLVASGIALVYPEWVSAVPALVVMLAIAFVQSRRGYRQPHG